MRPASAQSDQSMMCAQWVGKDPMLRHTNSEASDQTAWMCRLIWVFAGRTCHCVGFVMLRLSCSALLLGAERRFQSLIVAITGDLFVSYFTWGQAVGVQYYHCQLNLFNWVISLSGKIIYRRKFADKISTNLRQVMGSDCISYWSLFIFFLQN